MTGDFLFQGIENLLGHYSLGFNQQAYINNESFVSSNDDRFMSDNDDSDWV